MSTLHDQELFVLPAVINSVEDVLRYSRWWKLPFLSGSPLAIKPVDNHTSFTKALAKAQPTKNDEFYTIYEDVAKAVTLMSDQLKGKRIYCPCDSENSNFVKYLTDHNYNFIHSSNDFRSAESTAKLQNCDVVVTNPPFSLLREFLAWIVAADKEFLIVSPQTISSNPLCRELLVSSTIRALPFTLKSFITPTGEKAKICNCMWITNLPYENTPLTMTASFDADLYPHYDKPFDDIVECKYIKNIPKDYFGKIGVPATFLMHWNSKQFKILMCIKPKINSQWIFQRIVIQRTDQ